MAGVSLSGINWRDFPTWLTGLATLGLIAAAVWAGFWARDVVLIERNRDAQARARADAESEAQTRTQAERWPHGGLWTAAARRCSWATSPTFPCSTSLLTLACWSELGWSRIGASI